MLSPKGSPSATGIIDGVPVLLAKPQTNMNLTGESAGPLAACYKLPLNHVIVMYDDMDLPCGVLRIQPKGGHRRINGIGRPPGQMDPKAFLLQKFNKTAQERFHLELGRLQKIIADRDYGVDEQVMLRYRKFSKATLLRDFGFTLPYNIYDEVQLWMDVPSHGPLYAVKIELVNEHRFRRGTKSDGFPFIIKEVKSAEGKRKGIPPAPRAFARVLSAASVEDFESSLLHLPTFAQLMWL